MFLLVISHVMDSVVVSTYHPSRPPGVAGYLVDPGKAGTQWCMPGSGGVAFRAARVVAGSGSVMGWLVGLVGRAGLAVMSSMDAFAML